MRRTPEQITAGLPDRADITSYITIYSPESAQGRNSSQPGQRPPDGEVQIESQPIAAAHAQRALDAFNGSNGDATYEPWPRFDVVLANGERATVIPDRGEDLGDVRNGFTVITDTTLISVHGRFALTEIEGFAEQLRPV